MHLFLEKPVLSLCPKCGKPTLPHTVCHNCGYYKGVEVINVLEKLNKKERKIKEREMRAKEESASAKASADKGGLSWEGLSKK